MQSRKLFFVSLFAGLMVASPAFAGAGVSFFGEGNLLQQVNASSTTPKKLAIGGGAQVELGNGTSGVEIGAIYMPVVQKGTPSNVTFNYLQIPVQLRVWANRAVGVGVGGYYSFGLGEARQGQSRVTFASQNLIRHDYGLVGSLGAKIPMGKVRLLIEGRYMYGIANIATIGNPTRNWRGAQILLGLSFGGGHSRYSY